MNVECSDLCLPVSKCSAREFGGAIRKIEDTETALADDRRFEDTSPRNKALSREVDVERGAEVEFLCQVAPCCIAVDSHVFPRERDPSLNILALSTMTESFAAFSDAPWAERNSPSGFSFPETPQAIFRPGHSYSDSMPGVAVCSLLHSVEAPRHVSTPFLSLKAVRGVEVDLQ